MKFDFVFFFPCDWETPWRGRFLIDALSEKETSSKILCVERPFCVLTSFTKSPFQGVMPVCKENKVRRLKDNLFVYRPWIFLNEHLATHITLAKRSNVTWLRHQLQHIMDRYCFNKKAIVTCFYDPFYEYFVGMLNEILSVFDCYDEHTSVKSWSIVRTKQQIKEHEKRLMEKVDITFVVSDVLYRTKSLYAKNLYILRNAVDIKHFRPLDNNEIEDFKEMTEISRPIIGYLGSLSDKVDVPMLYTLAEKHPEWSFVIIGSLLGKISESIIFKRFIEKRNVYILGFQPYEQLPHYLNTFDVCFLPFVVNHPFNINCSPLKLYEYLAIGKPVVSTDIPYVRRFRDVIRIGKNVSEIENHIEECLNERNSLKEKRIAVAKENTWERRVIEMSAIIKDTIEKMNET
ncbi:MAG: glycosyltransferase [Candidatus Scalindua sp.]